MYINAVQVLRKYIIAYSISGHYLLRIQITVYNSKYYQYFSLHNPVDMYFSQLIKIIVFLIFLNTGSNLEIICKENSTYSCQNYTSFTCDGNAVPVPTKTSTCVKGCYCNDFYISDELTGNCVLPQDCTCPQNQTVYFSNPCFQECGRLAKIGNFCPLYEIQRCFCKPGFCNNMKGVCVPSPK